MQSEQGRTPLTETDQAELLTVYDVPMQATAPPPSSVSPLPLETLTGPRSCFLLGVGTLLPFSAAITSVDFLTAHYPKYANPGLWVTCLFLFPTYVIVMAQLAVGTAISLESRFIVGFGMCAVSLVCILVSSWIEGDWGWWGTMGSVFVGGIGEGLAEGALYPYAEAFSVEHVRQGQVGQGVSGLVVCCLRIVTRLIFLHNPEDGLRLSSYLYYAVACGGCVGCIVTLQRFRRTPEALAKVTTLSRNRDATLRSMNLQDRSKQFNDAKQRKLISKFISHTSIILYI